MTMMKMKKIEINQRNVEVMEIVVIQNKIKAEIEINIIITTRTDETVIMTMMISINQRDNLRQPQHHMLSHRSSKTAAVSMGIITAITQVEMGRIIIPKGGTMSIIIITTTMEINDRTKDKLLHCLHLLRR